MRITSVLNAFENIFFGLLLWVSLPAIFIGLILLIASFVGSGIKLETAVMILLGGGTGYFLFHKWAKAKDEKTIEDKDRCLNVEYLNAGGETLRIAIIDRPVLCSRSGRLAIPVEYNYWSCRIKEVNKNLSLSSRELYWISLRKNNWRSVGTAKIRAILPNPRPGSYQIKYSETKITPLEIIDIELE